MKKFILLISLPILAIAVALGSFIYILDIMGLGTPTAASPAVKPLPVLSNKNTAPPPAAPKLLIAMPIADALSRVTKKPFGLYVTPNFSPVKPERFTGYHTGVDFETTPGERDIDVPIFAICPGKILIKKTASGYGGVVNESCMIAGQAVTVTYGHLRLASIAKKVGQTLSQGEQIGVLGTGYSTETDGERKHLHLGIHKGAAAVITGYVATKAQLAPWINAMDYLAPKK
jgi:murein DD-endopeptidase MepM/ murein hydrolase activator NlpD